ncbi:hypothetical protein [Leptospira adleri]|uniref:Uncharacterized protein n=1 Tax=Leptospira adleri TaxID=2023186 RepID=A0A2M9YI76_9LEPT|nr:hypothetical protein [Leptospira adleri]PJZ51216.1 hypothetical protein CH380_21210 [Leptospira adleri]PJZ59657.1 hypothetical protein CH376_22600 [Leptospira adleri]
MPIKSISIHTLDARDYLFLPALVDHYSIGNSGLQNLVESGLEQLVDLLASRGIRYEDLRSSLTPKPDRKEMVLFFDRMQIESSWYGFPIHSQILSFLDSKSSHSILVGDLIAEDDAEIKIQQAFYNALIPSGNPFQLIETRQIYCVYINNLSSTGPDRLHRSLSNYKPYVGYADMTFSSLLKTFLSTTLLNRYLKFQKFILQPHSEAAAIITDENISGYNFSDYDLVCYSVPGDHYGVFLSYKIERPVLEGDEIDTFIAINTVSDDPHDISSFNIIIDDAKYNYLLNNKSGSLKKLNISNNDKDYLRNIILRKIKSNYIYNLKYNREYQVTQFDILMETDRTKQEMPTRFLAAFEYAPHLKALRLITLY